MPLTSFGIPGVIVIQKLSPCPPLDAVNSLLLFSLAAEFLQVFWFAFPTCPV